MKTNKITNFNYDAGYTKGTFTAVVFFLLVVLVLVILSVFSTVESKNIGLIDSLNTAQSVYFDFGSAELKSESYILLNKLADELKSNPDAKLNITGHTDDIGSENFNLELSEKRAEAVKQYLISKGCSSDNIFTQAKGKSEPVNGNNDDIERSLNRRVEFVINYNKKEAEEKDITYINSSLKQVTKNEVTGELSVRDISGEPIEGVEEGDVSAVLQWKAGEKTDSAEGSVRFIPIDDKKKIAYTFTMDYSPSMYDSRFEKDAPKTEKILAMENAVKTFLELMDDKNMGKIIKFGRVINVMQSFTKSKDALRKAIISGCYPREGTALFKSIYVALSDAAYEKDPTVMKTVIAFTDGEENSSGNITKDSIYKLSEFKGVKVYTVGLLDEPRHSIPLGLKSKDEADLVEIAARTGGFYWWARNSSDLSPIYKSILNQILKSYQVSIIWNEEKLPPKGTKVTAVVRVNINGRIRTIYKDYVME
ncbi:MAG: hypothetical protein EHM58_17445 [Ignavibacteriae bacterium]|nr:MAG: hypothetical protein EHM58_17445 [Ignavibacteriota bacterium]